MKKSILLSLVISSACFAQALPVGRAVNDPKFTEYIKDTFIGSAGSASGTIGNLGWYSFPTGSGGQQPVASVAGHPGIWQLITGATAASTENLVFFGGGATAGLSAFLPTDNFDEIFIVQPTAADTTAQQMRIGFGDSATAPQPNDGIYIEKLAADAGFVGVCRINGATQTRSAAIAGGTLVANNWYKLRIRYILSGTVAFSVNDGAEQQVATNCPTVGLTAFFYLANTSSTTNYALNIDYFDLLISGLSR